MKQDFSHQQRTHQEIWRKTNISTSEKGFQNKKDYEHIVPRNNWEETLWHEISAELPAYLKAKGVHAHTGTHNLLSSWVVCANLYFLARINQNFCDLMMRIVQIKGSKDICSYTGVELEFSFPTGDDLHHKNL
jgi:ribosomal protein S3AE